MKNIYLIISLAAAIGSLHAADEPKYGSILTEQPPAIPIPLGKTEAELTPAMREALAALNVDRTIARLHNRPEQWNYTAHPLYAAKSLHTFWISGKTLTPEEAIFAYTCLGLAAEDQIITPATLAQRLKILDGDPRFYAAPGYGSYMLKLACRPLSVKYPREPKAQAEEMRRVTDAAVAAAVRRQKAYLASREPDYKTKYDMRDDREAAAVADKLPSPAPEANKYGATRWQRYYGKALEAYNRTMLIKGALREHALQTEKIYPHECHFFARVFLQWLPGDKERVRRHLIEAGYTTPESRAEFWKIAGENQDYYYNDTHLATIRDLSNP